MFFSETSSSSVSRRVSIPSTYNALCFMLLFSVVDGLLLCNKNTRFECDCSMLCWDVVTSEETIDWLSVSLSDCPPQFNESILRKKISGWINEECNFALNCQLGSLMTEENIVLGQYICHADVKEVRLLALRNSSEPILQDNVLPSHILGQVIQSREHLLTFLLHAELDSVTVHRRFKENSKIRQDSLRWSLIFFSTVFIVFLFFIAIIIYFSQVYINWKKIVKGKWQCKEYKKVPDVKYSVDEMETGGHI